MNMQSYIPTFEANVPIPPKKRGPGCEQRPAPFGLADMEVGQSAFIPAAAYTGSPKQQNRLKALAGHISGALYGHRDLKSRKFTTRRSGNGIRVWRLS